jgi:hypothetical protein
VFGQTVQTTIPLGPERDAALKKDFERKRSRLIECYTDGSTVDWRHDLLMDHISPRWNHTYRQELIDKYSNDSVRAQASGDGIAGTLTIAMDSIVESAKAWLAKYPRTTVPAFSNDATTAPFVSDTGVLSKARAPVDDPAYHPAQLNNFYGGVEKCDPRHCVNCKLHRVR